jgi:DNA polymerase-3 subunit beta
MKFSLTQPDLLHAVRAAAAAVATRTTLPILTCIKLWAEDDRLHLAGTDCEMSLRIAVAADIAEPGALAVDAKMLLELVGAMPSVALTVSSDDTGLLTIDHGTGQIELHGLPGDEFPLLVNPQGESFAMPGADLAALLHHGSLAAAGPKDGKALTLCGVCLNATKDGLHAVSTNLNRLAVAHGGEYQGKLSIIIPTLVATRAVHHLATAETVTVFHTDDWVWFQTDTLTIAGRLIEGEFCNWKRVIPTRADTTITVNRREALNSVRLCTLLDNEDYGKIALKLEGIGLSLRSASARRGASRQHLAATVEGGFDPEMVFRAAYMLEGLAAFDDETVTLRTNGPQTPLTINGAGDFTYLLAPFKEA